MTDKNVVALEVAEAEFERFLESMDIQVDESTLDADDKAGFVKQRTRCVNAIRAGHLTIDDEGQAVYKPWRAASGEVGPITFHERTGSSLMAMDGKKKGHDVRKMYSMMADMTKLHSSTFAKLAGPDIKTCEAIFALLMD